jgi:uncharacterized membrane protein YdjX (TVP38/TMEM64 family)
LRRITILLLLVALSAGAALLYTHYRHELGSVDLKAALAGNPWAPLIFVALHIVVSLSFVPRTAMSFVAGVIFGLWGGILLTTIGAMAGSIAGFVLMRYLHRDLFGREAKGRLAWLSGVRQRLDEGGWRGVALMRLVPVLPHSASNYALGLTQISFGAYCLGSLIGLMPMTVVGVDAGVAGEQALSGGSAWIEPTVIGLVAIGFSFLLPPMLECLRRR